MARQSRGAKPEKRLCAFPGCKVRFVPYRKTQKYHDPAEGKRASNRRKIAPEMPERLCAFPGCDVVFKPERRTQKYHDVSEGDRARNARRLTEPVPGQPYAPARAAAKRYPEGWEPGIRLDGDSGHIVTRPTEDREPRFEEHLKAWGFDPDEYEVVEPVQVRTWDAPIGGGEVRQMWYYRASVQKRTHRGADPDVLALIREVKRHRPRRQAAGGDGALVVGLADWQAGKRDGDGVEGLVRRVYQTIEDVADRIAELRRLGRPVQTLYVAGMGDLVEACDGHYAMQAFNVELDRRDQTKLVRRLLVEALRRWAPLVERVVSVCVGGNHGENRKDGKAFTTFGDNDDVAVFEQVAEILRENPDAYGHVSFVIPGDDLTVTLEVAGQVVGFAHGHQARGGGTPEQKVRRWWKNQMEGQRPVGDATILVTGHYHHLQVVGQGSRIWFQCPALEDRSTWFAETAGQVAPAGTLTFRIDRDGWSDLAILGRDHAAEADQEAATSASR